MADDPRKFDFTQAITKLEQINAWFQNEDFNLDEGLQKLKEGKELIKKSRNRLQEVENEFVKIKREFADEVQESEVVEFQSNGHEPKRTDGDSSDDVPF